MNCKSNVDWMSYQSDTVNSECTSFNEVHVVLTILSISIYRECAFNKMIKCNIYWQYIRFRLICFWERKRKREILVRIIKLLINQWIHEIKKNYSLCTTRYFEMVKKNSNKKIVMVKSWTDDHDKTKMKMDMREIAW